MKFKVIATIALVFATLGVYVAAVESGSAGTGEMAQTPHPAADRPAAAPGSGASLPGVEVMVKQLAERLEREPEDASGWHLLGKSYEYLGQSDKAEAAFARAAGLGYQETGGGKTVPATIHGVIHLDPQFSSHLSGNETVFIFARAATGPRVPLAVLRRSASEFPIEFVLDDSMAMTPEYRLSGYDKVIVGARLTATGDAVASEGDLEGYSSIVSVKDAGEVVINIDQAVLMPAAVQAGEG